MKQGAKFFLIHNGMNILPAKEGLILTGKPIGALDMQLRVLIGGGKPLHGHIPRKMQHIQLHIRQGMKYVFHHAELFMIQ